MHTHVVAVVWNPMNDDKNEIWRPDVDQMSCETVSLHANTPTTLTAILCSSPENPFVMSFEKPLVADDHHILDILYKIHSFFFQPRDDDDDDKIYVWMNHHQWEEWMDELSSYSTTQLQTLFHKWTYALRYQFFDTKKHPPSPSPCLLCPSTLLTSLHKKPINVMTHKLTKGSKWMSCFYKKIILTLMIKNEERILRRCLERAAVVCDAYCITDTGSTDSTVSIIKQLQGCSEHPNPFVSLYQDTWQNFGSNRTLSFQHTVAFCESLGWPRERTFCLLLDGDLELCVKPTFDRQHDLCGPAHTVIQKTSSVMYSNVRFIRLDTSAQSVGVTHEYWSTPQTSLIPMDRIYIEDRGDGGCKTDKFERDLRLLQQGIQDEPDNVRYYFYLGQTLKDMGRFEEAIRFYRKRIELGGWIEEVWYSHYMIATCYRLLPESLHDMEYWANKAFLLRPQRVEPIYLLCQVFRERGEHWKAYQYYLKGCSIPLPTDDVLFVEHDKYKGSFSFPYERTILHYYVGDTLSHRKQGALFLLEYMNQYDEHRDNTFHNLKHYLHHLCDEGILLSTHFDDQQEWTCSSSSILPRLDDLEDGWIVNLRFVNYRIKKTTGEYTFEKGSHIETRNAIIYLDKAFQPIGTPCWIQSPLTDLIQHSQSWIHGIEDVRLFRYHHNYYYVGTTQEYTSSTSTDSPHNQIIVGQLDVTHGVMYKNRILRSPTQASCEKNWIPIVLPCGSLGFIYQWYPFQVGQCQSDLFSSDMPSSQEGELCITIEWKTPRWFERLRGSTLFLPWNHGESLLGVVHFVYYETPRIYGHQFIELDRRTLRPIKYSAPFTFTTHGIEYCIGFSLVDHDREVVLLFSTWDTQLRFVRYPLSSIVWGDITCT